MGAGLQTSKLFSLGRSDQSVSPFLDERLLAEEYPFPYDDQVFHSAERITNVRRSPEDPSSFKAGLNLLLKEGKKLDIKVFASDRKETLSQTGDVQSFVGVEGSLDCILTGHDSPRLYYQVQYREGQGPWRAQAPGASDCQTPTSKMAAGSRFFSSPMIIILTTAITACPRNTRKRKSPAITSTIF